MVAGPEDCLVVIRTPSGDFISGWRTSSEQAVNIRQRGVLGGV
ncbi:colicin D domain-containing protein [Mycobacterium sp. MYCO198283]